MGDISYRNIEVKDHEAIKSLINKTWPLDAFVQSKRTLKSLLYLYLNHCLMLSSFGQVALKDGSLVGIILGNAKNDQKPYRSLAQVSGMLFNLLVLLFSTKEEKKNFQEYMKIYQTYKDLIKNKKHLFDGELVFLAVAEEYRGLGIGKTLVNNLKEYFQDQSVHTIYLYTDTSCNYCFYDSQGFSRIGEREINLKLNKKPIDLTIFMYRYDFK